GLSSPAGSRGSGSGYWVVRRCRPTAEPVSRAQSRAADRPGAMDTQPADPHLSTDPRSRPHVLYVAWGFPPHRGPGTYRALATANLLADLGCRVTVLTADMATFDLVIGGDHSLMTAVDPRIRVLRVPFPPGRRDPVVNRWPLERVAQPTTWLERTV